MNLDPMSDDPDVAEATKVAKATQVAMGTGTVGREQISGALTYLLFTQVVEQRLGMNG
jgi:hypothetical protein